MKEGRLPKDLARPVIASFIAVLLLTGATVAAYRAASRLPSSIILPGGITYLGPSQAQEATPTPPPAQPPSPSQQASYFTAAPDTTWTERHGRIYSYSFSAPAMLDLITFPDDQNDAVAISWKDTPPRQNILLNIERLKQNPALVQYVDLPKRQYAENWWRQFSGLKGVASVTEFTNTMGLKGYRAKYINLSDQTPNEDVFLEVPGRPDLLIHAANGILDPDIFNRLVDSIAWAKSASAK